jgi:very-short-patch-repair endonuclease
MKQTALAYNGRRDEILLMLGFEFLVFWSEGNEKNEEKYNRSFKF